MATSLTSRGHQNAYLDVAASATATSLVAAAPGKKIRVHALTVSCGATPSTVVFNSASAANGPIFNNSISMPFIQPGWFETVRGEALTVTTGAGSVSGVLVVYSLVH